MKLTTTLLAGAALATLMACVPEDDTSTTSGGDTATTQAATTSDHLINLASFYSWPDGEANAVDIDAIGRDNMILLVDRSGSMDWKSCGSSHNRSHDAKLALTQFIPSIPDETAVGYMDFGSKNWLIVPPGLNNRAALMTAAQNHTPLNSGTNLGAATMEAIRILEDLARSQSSTGTYRIVIITDGAADDPAKLRRAVESTRNTPIEIMTAGFCMSDRHVLNQEGETVFASASNVDEVAALLTQSTKAEAAAFATFEDTSSE